MSNAKPAFQPQDIFRLESASDLDMRPDGGEIAYVRRSNSIRDDRAHRSIWLINVHTGFQRRLTDKGRESFAPRWSPDGSRIAFVSASPDGHEHIEICDAATATMREILSSAGELHNLAWSPDGGSIAFVMPASQPAETIGRQLAKPAGAQWAPPLKITSRVEYLANGIGIRAPGYDHVFVVDTMRGVSRRLTTGPFDDAGPPSWSPDGLTLLFSARRDDDWEHHPLRSSIYGVEVATGALRRLTTLDGPFGEAAFSPDGKKIAFTGYRDEGRLYENFELFVMNANGSDQRSLTHALDRSVHTPRWAADGSAIYASFVDHGVIKVARIGRDQKIDTVAQGLAGPWPDLPYATAPHFSVGANGVIAFIRADFAAPPQVALVDHDKVKVLTSLSSFALADRSLASLRPLDVHSAADGARVDAWMVLPPNFDPRRKWPMILEIHGGPTFISYAPMFATDYQLYAAAGFVVLFTNPRGSDSSGANFANGIWRNWPGIDYDDMVSAVDAAIAQGFVDPRRLFVTGGSAGGTMSAWIIGKTHRFAAAAVQKPSMNWSSANLTSSEDVQGAHWFDKPAWEDPAGYWARSPLSLLGQVSTPTLVAVGDRDTITQPSEAEQLYVGLQRRHVPTALVVVPGASHDMSGRPSQSAAKAEAIVGWFQRYDPGASKP